MEGRGSGLRLGQEGECQEEGRNTPLIGQRAKRYMLR
jgi:hypothetical protein